MILSESKRVQSASVPTAERPDLTACQQRRRMLGELNGERSVARTSLHQVARREILECSGLTEPSIPCGTKACHDSTRRRDERRPISAACKPHTDGGDGEAISPAVPPRMEGSVEPEHSKNCRVIKPHADQTLAQSPTPRADTGISPRPTSRPQPSSARCRHQARTKRGSHTRRRKTSVRASSDRCCR